MRFCLSGRDISDRFEQATIVEPIDPFEGGEFDRLGTAPRAAAVDYLGFEQVVDGIDLAAVALTSFAPLVPATLAIA